MSSKPRVKICCISSSEEAKLAINYGADAIGLVGRMPSGPGIISDDLISEIAQQTPPPISTFLLTSETKPKAIITHHKKVNTSVIQLVDSIGYENYEVIKSALPSVKLVQVIHVLGKESIEESLKVSEKVDALLLDSGNPNLNVKILGGTGKTHNWKISRSIVEQSKVPVLLAGGINPDNVRRALEEVQPFGVDLCNGVRTDGKLDEKKLNDFFEEINKL